MPVCKNYERISISMDELESTVHLFTTWIGRKNHSKVNGEKNLVFNAQNPDKMSLSMKSREI